MTFCPRRVLCVDVVHHSCERRDSQCARRAESDAVASCIFLRSNLYFFFCLTTNKKGQLNQLTAACCTAAALQPADFVAAAVGCLVATRVVEGELFIGVYFAHREERDVVAVLRCLRPHVRLQRKQLATDTT